MTLWEYSTCKMRQPADVDINEILFRPTAQEY